MCITAPPLTNITNLSRLYILDQYEAEVLNKGLSFIPTPNHLDGNTLLKDIHRYHRKLNILDFFHYETLEEYIPFQDPSNWEPPQARICEKIKKLIKKDSEAVRQVRMGSIENVSRNLTPEHHRALRRLENNENIVLKQADKGSKIVLLDRSQYLREAYRQLNNTNHYSKLTHSLQQGTQLLQKPILERLQEEGFITKRQMLHLSGPDSPRCRLFYLLPKIHKKLETWPIPGIPPGRPIVSDCGSESYNIAKYIDFFLNPLSQHHQSYIKDTYHFISKIKDNLVPVNTFFFTIDINSLYTNIDTELGLRAVREAFDNFPDPTRPDNAILDLLRLGLTKNDFEFNEQHFLQIHGTAMGKTFAPSYANIYMAHWEETVFPKCRRLPKMYLRYLDDIFGLWEYTLSDFHDFINTLNSHHPTITVTHNIQNTAIEFLDTEVFFIQEHNQLKKLATRVFFKKTDTHALLHKTSYHPKHTFKGIVKSQIIRFRRICSLEEDVEIATRTLFAALRPRSYSRRFLRYIKSEVRHTFTAYNSKPRTKKQHPLIPFVHTYSTQLQSFNKRLKYNFTQLQEQVPELKDHKVIAAYRRNKNLKDLLIHTRLNREDEDNCFFIFPSYALNSVSGKGLPIHKKIDPHTQNVVYAIKCMTCGAIYIGETMHTMDIRLKQHLYCIRKYNKKTVLYTHFQTHSVDHLRMMGLETRLAWNRRQRQNCERKWIRGLNTLEPWGLNERW